MIDDVNYYFQDDDGNFLTVWNTWANEPLEARKYFGIEDADGFYISQFEFGEKRMTLVDVRTQLPIKVYNDIIL